MTLGVDTERRIVRAYQDEWDGDFNSTCKRVFSQNAIIKSVNTVKRIAMHWLLHGITPQQAKYAGKRARRRVIDAHRHVVEKLVDDDAGLYLDEIADLVEMSTGTRYSEMSISRALKKYGYQLRTLFVRASQRDERLHRECLKRIREYEPRQLIFVDETHQDERQARRRRGWAKRRRVPTVFEPLNNTRFTVIGACNLDGFVLGACETIKLEPHIGVDGARFLRWVQEKLAPCLGNFMAGEKNSVVVMDNASVHKGFLDAVVAAIRARGAIIEFLSPYSPDLSPIEEAFSKVKKGCRRMRKDYLANPVRCIATAFARVTSSDMHGYYRHSGYRVPNLAKRQRESEAAGVIIIVALVLKRRRK